MNIRKSAAGAALVLAAAALAITTAQAVAAPGADSHDAGVSLSMQGKPVKVDKGDKGGQGGAGGGSV